MINHKRIKKDCFWELDISNEEIDNIVTGKDERKKKILFEKILLNSTALFQDMRIFNKEQLGSLLENYKIPKFNEKYARRRKNMVEVYFFDKPLLIDELKWVA